MEIILMKLTTLIFGGILAAAVAVAPVQAREQISIVGSSTVFPYTQAVAEEFVNLYGFSAPVVEATGTGGGMKLFCAGVGENTPDLTGASRAIKDSEAELCAKNGVEYAEVLVGYDGIVIAQSLSGEPIELSVTSLFAALASDIPSFPDGSEIVTNPTQKWNDVWDKYPDTRIIVYGPPPTSGTRDAFVELALEVGCNRSLDYLGYSIDDVTNIASRVLDEDAHEQICKRMRTDGPFIEAGENDNIIVQRLNSDPEALGIFGYSFLFENTDTLRGLNVNGVAPSRETIADGSYPLSRPLYFYVKLNHMEAIPGLADFVAEYVSEEAFGDDGYLTERGLVPLPIIERDDIREELGL